jgi:hypothetical protein
MRESHPRLPAITAVALLLLQTLLPVPLSWAQQQSSSSGQQTQPQQTQPQQQQPDQTAPEAGGPGRTPAASAA